MKENVELNLGLSLNGKFGINPEKVNKNKLFRALSETDFLNFPVDVELSLSRTCSLPVDTAVELRKRKELQLVRRSEAKRKRVEKLKQLPPAPPRIPKKISSQGSIVSQGSGGSSGLSDLDSPPFPGVNKGISETNECSESNRVQWNVKTKPKVHCAMDPTMPCVSTKGDGPDGKRIQGFLYRYGKGEEVRIVCVCHGSFLTPAEFVKHGGGGDVDHPLRHIVVTSSLFS